MESPPRDFKSLASTIPPLGQQEEFITIAPVGKSDKGKEKPDPHSANRGKLHSDGPPCEARTHDPLIKSQVLYH